jgi:uncharacterized protein
MSKFVWYDLMTPNVEASKTFYGKVLGLTFAAQPPAYTLCNVDNIAIGGMLETPAEMKNMPSFWAGYIYTESVNAACAKIRELGGIVHRDPWDIPGMLRMAVVSDPTGGVFNLMEPLRREELVTPKEGAQGAVGWNELHTSDLGKGLSFYKAMFGWTAGLVHSMGADVGDYQLFQLNGKDLGGMMKKMAHLPMSLWAYYFCVDGIDAAVARVTEAGGTVAMGPHQVPGGQWTLNATDPHGAFFSLISKTK